MDRHVAGNIRRAMVGQPRQPFRHRDKGSFATIGRGKAVGDLRGGWKLSGFTAWLAWLAIHLFFLIGFRNRVLVIFQWAYSYVTFRRGARLITGRPRHRSGSRADVAPCDPRHGCPEPPGGLAGCLCDTGTVA
jgi:NADH:quinone reductase (non-electrogenic)